MSTPTKENLRTLKYHCIRISSQLYTKHHDIPVPWKIILQIHTSILSSSVEWNQLNGQRTKLCQSRHQVGPELHIVVWSAPTKAPLISGTISSCVEVVMVMWRVQMICCVDYLDSSMGKPTSFSYALSYIMLHKIMIFHQLLLIHADWLVKPCHVTVNLHAFLKRGFGFRIKWVILVICSYDHLI